MMILQTVDELYSVNWFVSWKKKINKHYKQKVGFLEPALENICSFKRILEMKSKVTKLIDLIREKT